MNTKVSIIIRTKNEARWIKQCLSAVFSQNYKNFEVILVDNNSIDATVKKASVFDIKLVNIENYKPGFAINKGIENSTGDIFVILSGHCIPTNEFWLENLINNLEDHNVAGVYGRQESLSFSADSDKRDLAIVFGLDKKIQKKDTFFHNANSALRREVWKKFPFDNDVKHIEDRLWGKKIIEAGYKIVYEPEASVFHYHGIHQNNHPLRLKNIVKILEDHEVVPNNKINEDLNNCILVPINNSLEYINEKSTLFYLAETIKASKNLDMMDAIICSNIPDVIKEANKLGFDKIYKRPEYLLDPFVTVEEVIKNTLLEYDFDTSYPDIIIYMSPGNPYRSYDLIDKMYSQFAEGEYDVLFPTYNEKRTIWLKDNEQIRKFEKSMPTKYKKGIEIAILGLCTIARSEYYLDYNEQIKVGLYEVEDPLHLIDLKTTNNKDVLKNIL